jgi:hypothetical protein
LRDRDVMNLLDQLELYFLEKGDGQVSQAEFWLFVFKSMKSGQLMTEALRDHLMYKLKSLGVKLAES